ncbi:MAG: hypothetical protein RLZZ383_2616 [Pseudomonadota bacterium]
MRRWAWSFVGMAACASDPVRPDLSTFPSALDDTFTPPPANTCDAPVAAFSGTATGGVERTFEGLASYEFDNREDRTSFYLVDCPGRADSPRLAFHNFGIDRLGVGTYTFDAVPEDAAALSFSYVQLRDGAETRCVDAPEGLLEITASDASTITGAFDVEVGCRDASTGFNPSMLTQFHIDFVARNIGVE